MLLQFSVKNFKTFKDKATLSLIANSDKSTREEDNVVFIPKYNLRVLKSAVIYGANASGKSKLIEALGFMKIFSIISSKDSQKGDEISVEPFRLNTETENEPSEFEVLFIYKDILYRYGFEVNRKQVVSEWLYFKPKTKEIEIFYRNFQEFETHPKYFKKGDTLVNEKLVRDNALMLSVAAQFNDEICTEVLEWFMKLGIISGLADYGNKGYTLNKTNDIKYREKILKLIKAADLNIQEILHSDIDLDNITKDIPNKVKEMIKDKQSKGESLFIPGISEIFTLHKKYDNFYNYMELTNFSLEKDESIGTVKYFYLSGPILDSLDNGHTLVIDELDTSIHPNLVEKIVSLFNSKETNPNNAQLVFNTQNTNLLDSDLFRRDQIWFTEKNRYGEATLFSLADFKTNEVRKNEDYENNYLKGKYGAVPYLNLFNDILITNNLNKDGKKL